MGVPVPLTFKRKFSSYNRLRGLLSVATRSLARMKNVSRIQASMKVYVTALRPRGEYLGG